MFCQRLSPNFLRLDVHPVLQTRLNAIDMECESEARSVIDSFFAQARYDGQRFRYPPLKEVSAVWLQSIRQKESKLIEETCRVFDAMVAIEESQVDTVLEFADVIFEDDRYVDRLTAFCEGIVRRASSYGITFNPEVLRLDLVDALYRAGVCNECRRSRGNFRDALQIYFSNRKATMSISSLMTDKVSLLKKDGTRFDELKASVQSNKIFISGADHFIEPGDLIQRKMSNGGEETFEVIDPGFHEKFHGIPAGYQMVVKKLGLPEARSAVHNITYNIAGNNARINQNSVDNSTNTVNVNTDLAEYITALRGAINDATLEPAVTQSAVEVIDAVDSHLHSGRPSKTVVSTLLSALPHVGNVASIAASIISLC
jgi:hypothetical protein